ncbi:acyl carrier protein [uncultured Ruminococcus sp.]|uniref:acyl carrier protein n=1 Tax=uncultured Ruminococcus sp. TaxID=165186 RepID=UPI002624227B|nr:acyl carrier protein [uncultured Ruminococcus sp.]
MIDYDKFVGMICERFGIDTEEAKKMDSFETMGIDSLTLYSIVSQVESELGIRIDTNDITQVNSLSKLYDYSCRMGEVTNEA